MSKVYANGRSVVHKGDGQVNTCTLPDVCKTPSPGGPVPIPYVNVAQDGDLADGSTSVSIEGNPVAVESSNLSTSSGDEAGTAGGGLISSKTKGKMTWGSHSIDVKIEGKGVIRFLDITQHNGNTFNVVLAQKGDTKLFYGNDPFAEQTLCPLCEQSKEDHRLPETRAARANSLALYRELKPAHSALRREEESGDLQGYMIGTLTCQCQQKVFTAASGRYVGLFSNTIDRINAKRKAGDPEWVQCTPLLPDMTITNLSKKQIPLRDYRIPGRRMAPGTCAGPRLIAEATKRGHIPVSMSEVWFFPPVSKKLIGGGSRRMERPIPYFTWNLTTNQYEPKSKRFGPGESVPSCEVCQQLLTPLLCDIKDKKCSGS